MNRHWFLSYHSADFPLADGVCGAIRASDPQAHVFFAPKSLRGGGYWQPALAQEIEQASAFVLLVGENGVGPWQVLEYYEALDRRVKSPDFAVLLLLREGQSAPGLPFLRQLHWIIADDPASKESVARLIDAASGSGTRPGQLWRHTSPYRGLAAMTEADSDFFFGRKREAVEVLKALAASPDRLAILLGNSGVGKSSLAQAGVIAALKRQDWPEGAGETAAWPRAFGESRQWCFLRLNPGIEPLKALVETFLETWGFDVGDATRLKRRNEWVQLLLDGEAKLADLIDETERRYAELGQPKPPAFFLYIDQGEELYAHAERRQARRFSELVAHGLSDIRITALMSLRTDFFGELQNDEMLFGVHRQINVAPMREAELREVVNRPATLLSARFETEALAPAIARRAAEESVKDAGALPLLSYLLDDMWTQMVERGDGVLRLSTHAIELGGVLVERADAFLARNPKAEDTLRRMLTLKLATVREDGEPIRRRALRSEFSNEEWRLVSELAAHPHRLLVTVTPEGRETYTEVAHEAIFRRWERLNNWIVAERDFLVWKGELEADRRRWEQAPAPSRADALLMGLSLAQAKSWLGARSDDLAKADREFIQHSLEYEKLTQRQKRAFWRRVAVSAMTALAAVIILATFSFFQWRQIENQRVEVLKREQLSRQERDPYVIRGNLRSAIKNYDLAITDFTEAVAFDPSNAVAYRNRGAAYANKLDYDRAIADYGEAIKLDPKYTWAYNDRGNAFTNKQDYDHAIADYSEAIKLDPKYTWAYRNRGAAYANKLDYDRAIADYNEAIKLDPKFNLAYNDRGNAFYFKRDYDRAVLDYGEAIKLDPKYVTAYDNRGNAFTNKQDYDHAIADYSEAIKLDPKYAWAYRNRGFAYANKLDYDRAIADYNEAIKLDPKYTLAYNDRGNAFTNKQDYDHAIADYSEAIKLDPKYAWAYRNRGAAYANKLDYDRAIADYNEAIKLDPKLALAYNDRGNAFTNKQDYDHAIADYSEAVKLDPKYAWAYRNRGFAYANKLDYDRAIADYNEAIKLDPKFTLAYADRALAYNNKFDYDRAIADYNEAISLNPTEGLLYNNRGVAYRNKGELDWAIHELDHAIMLNSKSGRLYYNRGSAHRAKGNYNQTLEDYRQAIDLDPNEAGAYSARCWQRLMDGAAESAAADCDESLRLRPNDAFAFDSRGIIHLSLSQIDNAIADFDAALTIFPKFASPLYGRGIAKLKKGDVGAGNADINAAKAIRPDIDKDFVRYGIR